MRCITHLKGKLSVGLMSLSLLISTAFAAEEVKDAKEQPFGERSIFSERATAERVKPAGSLCLKGEDCGTASATAGEAEVLLAQGPRSGDEVYNTKCLACHGSGVAGAPKMGDAADWATRAENGMEALVANAINGVGAMPPKGLCMDCSDDEIKAAVEYIMAQSK